MSRLDYELLSVGTGELAFLPCSRLPPLPRQHTKEERSRKVTSDPQAESNDGPKTVSKWINRDLEKRLLHKGTPVTTQSLMQSEPDARAVYSKLQT